MRAVVPVLLLSATLLAGCVGVSPEAQRAADEGTCRSYGFKPRTDAFAECLQRIDLGRDADRRARLYGDYSVGRGGIGIGIGSYGRVW